jgi:hypothetical protein
MPNINDLTGPVSPIAEFARIQPRLSKNVPLSQGVYPTEERPAPQRLVRPSTPPSTQRIVEIANEVADALELASTAPTTYEKTKNLPPSHAIAELRAKIQKLESELRQAQSDLETELAKPSALETYIDSALQAEQTVQYTSQRLLTALVDLDLQNLLGVTDRQDSAIEIIQTLERKRGKVLRSYRTFMSLHRAVSAKVCGELNVQTSVARSKVALQKIADVLSSVSQEAGK